jgi:hypothetical protein
MEAKKAGKGATVREMRPTTRPRWGRVVMLCFLLFFETMLCFLLVALHADFLSSGRLLEK